MPFHTKIQPIDVSEDLPTMKQMPKSRLKRLFERRFSIKNTTTTTSERLFTVVPPPLSRGNSGDLEPSSVCLAKMVVNFIEGNNNNKEEEEKQRCGRSRCSCFTGSGTESSAEDESDDLKCSCDNPSRASDPRFTALQRTDPNPSIMRSHYLHN